MPRPARVVIPGLPHHARRSGSSAFGPYLVMQRGNRRQKVFSLDEDYEA